MTQEQVMEWMHKYLDGTQTEQAALKMIKLDISEHGFENWLNLPAIPIVEWYIEAIDEVTDGLVEDYRTVKGVEDIIGKAGIGQSMLLEDTESLLAFKNGVMDAVNSLLIYLTTQEMANAYYEGNTN